MGTRGAGVEHAKGVGELLLSGDPMFKAILVTNVMGMV